MGFEPGTFYFILKRERRIGLWWGSLKEKTTGRHRRKWEDNIKRGCEDMNWIKLVEDRDKLRAVVSTPMNFCVPYSEGVGWLGGWVAKELAGI